MADMKELSGTHIQPLLFDLLDKLQKALPKQGGDLCVQVGPAVCIKLCEEGKNAS